LQISMDSIFAFLDTTQASLIIYLCTSALLILCLAININYWKRIPLSLSRRLAIGLLVMLFVELVAFGATILLSSNPEIAGIWLPPIDRFQMAFLLLWLMWIWAFPDPSPWSDMLAAFLALGLGAALFLTLNIWSLSDPTNNFNTHWLDLGWQLASLGFLIMMVVIIYIRRKRLWGAGVLTGLLFICGHTLQLIFPSLSSNYPGPVRLVALIAIPLLLLLPQHFIAQPSSAHTAGLRHGRDKRDRRRFSTELPTALGFLSLAWEDNPQTAMQLLVKSIGQALLADVCLFTTQPNPNGQVTILTGYDFFNHLDIKETRIDRQRIPLVANALSQTRNLRLPGDYTDTPDINSLCRLIRHNGTAPLLVHPVNKSNAWQIGGILLLTPHSQRTWTTEDTAYVAGLVEALLRIIEHNQSQLITTSLIQNLTDEQRESGQTIINLQNELQQLYTQLDAAQAQMAVLETASIPKQSRETAKEPVQQQTETDRSRKAFSRDATVKLDPLVVDKHDTIREIAKLRDENEALRQLITHISGNPEVPSEQPEKQTARELRLSLQEVARLKNMLADADMKFHQLDRKLKGGS
jgi:GAF domain-containing protein